MWISLPISYIYLNHVYCVCIFCFIDKFLGTLLTPMKGMSLGGTEMSLLDAFNSVKCGDIPRDSHKYEQPKTSTSVTTKKESKVPATVALFNYQLGILEDYKETQVLNEFIY